MCVGGRGGGGGTWGWYLVRSPGPSRGVGEQGVYHVTCLP